jgi:hypothetical protein
VIKLTDILSESPTKKLRVFDFDDTIAKSNSRVKVTHKDGTISMLTPGEYAVYDKKDGDVLDYSEFQKVIDPKEIKAIVKILRTFYNAGGQRKITILTARGVVKPIRKFMSTIGIKNIEIVALNDSDPQKKADWIEDMVKNKGYNDVFFIDDSEKNVRAVSALKMKYPSVRWNVRLAKYR